MDLDEMLDVSAPHVTARTPQLEHELDYLAAACEAAHFRRRRPVRIALVGGVSAAVLSLGAIASATGVLPSWPAFSTSSGQTCEIEISATSQTPGDGEPISSTFSRAEQEQTLASARQFLDGFDYNAVDRQQAIAWWKAEESESRSTQPDPAERQPRLIGDDLEVTSVSMWVVNQLRMHLAAQGLDIRAINVSTSSSGCMP